MLSNPPFGVTWGGKDGYQDQAEKLRTTRYSAGMPSSDDGALLFLQTILAKMKPLELGGSKVAIIFNGSPLSNGDCGSGESEIRRWILENDWLDAIVMLPNELFYNTGIFTYIWLLRNDRAAIGRNGRIMLIDGRQQFEKEPKSFGSKRNRITEQHRQWIEHRYHHGWEEGFDDDNLRFFTRHDFAFHKVEVVFWQTDEQDQPAIITEPFPVQFKAANVRAKQEFYASDMTLHIRVNAPQTNTPHQFDIRLGPEDSFLELYKAAIKKRFGKELGKLTAASLDRLEPRSATLTATTSRMTSTFPLMPRATRSSTSPSFWSGKSKNPSSAIRTGPSWATRFCPTSIFTGMCRRPLLMICFSSSGSWNKKRKDCCWDLQGKQHECRHDQRSVAWRASVRMAKDSH